MKIHTVAVMAPGDMGHAVGTVLREAGKRVITCLEGRSEHTRARSAKAGIVDVGDDVKLVREADVLLSILPPAQAYAMAQRLAAAVAATSASLLYVECNAIAPRTTREIERTLTPRGIEYVDGGIIGGPPAAGAPPTRLYLSGPEAPQLMTLATPELEVRVLGPAIGAASGLKMCYASITKGLTALGTEALAAARALGLGDELRTELEESQSALLHRFERGIPGMPPKAGRWIGEMEEIATTFGDVGLPPGIMLGAAAMYRLVNETRVPSEPERETLDEVLAVLVAQM